MTAIMGIVISDLVPLRWRSAYQAILAVTYAFGMAIGPVVEGGGGQLCRGRCGDGYVVYHVKIFVSKIMRVG